MFKQTIHRPKIIIWYMDFFDYDGLTTFWETIYYKDLRAMNDTRLVKHELMHAEQMKRDGKIKYHLKYAWYSIIYGYWHNPYEVEARKAENL